VQPIPWMLPVEIVDGPADLLLQLSVDDEE
jgi:hypothetical protein